MVDSASLLTGSEWWTATLAFLIFGFQLSVFIFVSVYELSNKCENKLWESYFSSVHVLAYCSGVASSLFDAGQWTDLKLLSWQR